MPILLDKSWYEANKKQSIPFSLNLYNLDLKYANKEQIDYAKQKVRIFGKEIRIIRSILKRIQGSRIASPCRYDEYGQEYLQPNCFMYFSGYFQNPRYFKGISSHIKKYYTHCLFKAKSININYKAFYHLKIVCLFIFAGEIISLYLGS